ncbi:MAG: DNA translocase FtsK 4TM domain-containing protein [Candidatus Paceibacterota bacterium]
MPQKKRKRSSLHFFEELRKETVHAVLAVTFFVIAFFLVIAAFRSAGVGGELAFKGLSFLLGVGYYILPVLLVLLGISFFRGEEAKIGWLKGIGSLLFFVASLGLIETLLPRNGGVIGDLISSPLIAMVDLYASILILSAVLVISVIVILDAQLDIDISPFTNLIRRKKKEEETEPTVYGEEYDDEEETEEYEAEEDPDEDVPEEKTYEEKISLYPEGGIRRVPIGVYTPPPLSLLERDKGKPGVGDTKANSNIIKRTLQNFGITVDMDEISVGPTVTRYALKPAEGVRISRIVSLQNNLELALAASPVRIEAPIPGKPLVGIEVPNTKKATLGLASLLSTNDYQESEHPLLITLGRDIAGAPIYANLAKMPHVLIAGTTGSGKSATIHSIVTSLVYRNAPETMRFLMIDPKRVELTLYKEIPHLLTPVVTDAKKAILALKWTAKEMDRRYDILEAESVRDVFSYHKNVLEPALKKAKGSEEDMPEIMPYIVIIIDELADIMQAYPRELESAIVRLAQMSRAVGIHLILSTQRPSVNVITGLIKANIPARIALQVSSQVDSRTILDTGGAEKLLGAGDMLYLSGEMSKPTRIQSGFISENEVKSVASFLRKHNDYGIESGIDLSGEKINGNGSFPSLDEAEENEDDLYEEAREIIVHSGKASTSYLQRKLRIGYARAARLMDILEERGIIGPADGARPREVFESKENNEDEYDDEESENGRS